MNESLMWLFKLYKLFQMHKRGTAMSKILYPEQRPPCNKDFLKEHVRNIRKTVRDNRQKGIEVCE